ncbi:MAG: DUF86 domain-containing protein, partial [Nitrospiraceae bacterium]|nr:DUF86 domain-containing protein [Nitrospiraceae bacterium]
VAARLEGVDRDEFDGDEDLRDALAHRVQIIGEAASRLSAAFREAYPHIPWHRLIGMRHRIVHDYMNVDYDILWEVATRSLPELLKMLGSIVPDDA